ncbi:hypothetical protein DY000_02040634 [Brassica cretica]|uniref:Uncharacterized protein n=1 Tax=Brassica cretica TaxID=69181 RepID=A0ABQ7BH30_BRACR|nr:hypothetical protein DY000_02040634 [Brassica cretica]
MLKHMDLETASIAAKNGIDPFHVAVKKVISVKEHSDVSNGNSRTLFYRITCFDTYLGCACRHIEDLLDVFGSGHENRFFCVCNALHKKAIQACEGNSHLPKMAKNNGKSPLCSSARMGHVEVVK